MPGNEPQTDVHILSVPCDAALETTPTITELTLLACPTGAGYKLAIVGVGFRANTLPIDGSNTVLYDLEFVDAAGGLSANLVSADSLVAATKTVLVYNNCWRGFQVLEPGDAINVEFAVTTPDTASEGAAFVIEYKILERSAA